MSDSVNGSGVDQEGSTASTDAQARESVAAVIAGGPDGWQIAMVKALRHRANGRHSCKCEECRAIVRVCTLAAEALAMKAARSRRAPTTGETP